MIGREAELAWVRAAIGRPAVRLLTLTGPGGVGKTRLALELTAELAPEFPDGAYFVSLAELDDPALVLPAIAQTIGLRHGDSSPIADRLHAKLAPGTLLLTLDNLEHVAAVAPELVQLLAACPGVTILVTSRSPLGVEGEHVLPIPPLPIPDLTRNPTLAELGANEAVTLLVQRARVADPNFALTQANAADVARICALVEGLPLALELAAVRLQVLSPAALLERLASPLGVLTRGDPSLPKRHQTLRATIAWSENLLSPLGRALLRQLSVFAGGCSAVAAEAMWSDPERSIAPCEVLDCLAELLDHGFLRREMVAGEPRFVMPELICEYALERLEESGEAEAAQRPHATYFLNLSEEAAPAMLGPDQEAWVARLETEHHNLRAALRWSLAHEPAVALQLAQALWRFWYIRGHLREGRRWLERTLATGAGRKTVARVRALNGLGALVCVAGDLERALELQNASLSLARELADRWGVAAAEGDRAIIEFMLGGDAERARAATEDVLSQFRALGDRYSEATALTALGNFALAQGNLAESTHRFEEALAIARESGDGRGEVLCLCNLARTARLLGELDQAAALYREGLSLAHRLGAQEDILDSLAGLGGLAVERRQFERAARLLGAAAALADAIGAPLQPAEQTQFDHDVAAVRAALPVAAFSRALTAGRSLPLDAAVAEALEGAGAAYPVSLNHGLSDRELDVLRLIAKGMSDREIAAALFISPGTVMTHVKHIRTKLGVHSRGAAAAYAVRHGLV
jgi:non-specific serine/threonine protein kinase